jgi:hypothetical protein
MIVNSRIQESFRLSITNADPNSKHDGSTGHGWLRLSTPDIYCTNSKDDEGMEGNSMRA